jgi:predicted dehydrogenase
MRSVETHNTHSASGVADRREVSIGIVGGGRIAHVHARRLQQLPGVRLTGVFDPAPQQANRFSSDFGVPTYPSLDAVLADPRVDAVIDASPVFAHHDNAVAIMRAGKHLFEEKPLALALPAADDMLDAAQETGVVVMVGHVLRHMEGYVRIHDAVDQGRLGDVHTIYAARLSGLDHDGSWQGWMNEPGKGLAALDAHIHDLDYIDWVMGPVESVRASGWRFPSGTWAHATSWLRCAEGRVAVAEASYDVPRGFPFTYYLRAIGSEGAAVFSFEGPDYATPTRRTLAFYRQGEDPEPVEDLSADPYLEQMTTFVACVRNHRQPDQGRPADARTALAITLAVQQSLERGDEVHVDRIP